jgi:hypothetical protein
VPPKKERQTEKYISIISCFVLRGDLRVDQLPTVAKPQV